MAGVKKKEEKSLPADNKTDSKKTAKGKKSTKSLLTLAEPQEEDKPHFKRIYLYLHIENIENLPECENDIVIRLDHPRAAITKMVDHYTTNTEINLTQHNITQEPLPTFAVMIDQDSIEEMNVYSDNPILITLFRYIPEYTIPIIREDQENEKELTKKASQKNLQKNVSHHSKAPEEEEFEVVPEQWIAKAQACIDMLQFFNMTRNLKTLDVFMYPLQHSDEDFVNGTCKIFWKIYSLLPLMKSVDYQNMAFISLESIYNMKQDILQDEAPLLYVDLSFESNIPNEKKEYEKVKICTFRTYNIHVIESQKPYIAWESVNNEEMRGVNNIGIQFGCKLEIFKLLSNLLKTEDVDFRLDDIDKEVDTALVYNSCHRYVLTRALCDILEDVLAFNQQHILVEVYRPEEPENILLRGKIDISIFVYPRVNAMRFAVELTPPEDKSSKKGKRTSKSEDKKMTAKGKTQKQQAMGDSGSIQQDRPTFAIVNICMLTPLTEKPEPIANNTNNVMRKDQLNYCAAVEDEAVRKTTEQILSESYFQYDEVIGLIIDYIVNNDITSTEDHKHSLCCQLGNLVNKIVKIIAYDFNKRVPTENNIQFMNLMTTVYKELVERQYNILQNCVDNDLSKCFIPDLERQDKIITMLTMSKYMDIAGNPEMAQLLHGKVVDDNPSNSGLNFYTFLYDVEKMNFDEARTYFKRPIREKDKDGEYFSLIAEIYIDYLEKLNDKETEPEAYEFLLLRLQLFLNIYPLEMDCWILLYCLYRSSGYLPGISYTRWKYENLTDKPRHQLPRIPKSRWEIYCKYKLKPSSTKAKLFYTVFEIFMMTGLYQFAEFIYYEMMDELNEAEKFFTKTTLKILQDKVEPKYPTKTFPVEKMPNGLVVGAFQAQNNGNLEFHKGNKEQAMMQYGKIVDSSLLTDYEDFHLSLFRYGYYMLENGQYEKAVRAFTKCTQGMNDNGLATYMGLGKAKYWAGKLEDARYFFARSTCYEIHIPDIWAYLALINLKLKDNFKALECWKYAKLDPKTAISDEILAELDTIDYNDVNLYVDIPEPTQMTQMTYTANQ